MANKKATNISKRLVNPSSIDGKPCHSRFFEVFFFFHGFMPNSTVYKVSLGFFTEPSKS